MPDARAALAAGVDGVVIAAATPAHARLILAAVEAGIPVFCEKPIAFTAAESRDVVARLANSTVPVQIGYNRRFDPAYLAAYEAVRAGELGRLTTVRSTTMDPAPPPPAYVAASGGIFRDCSVHDFDIVRWIVGREVVEVYATGTDHGEAMFAEAGDAATAQTLLTFDDGTLGVVSNTRYNGRGYDCRLELHGSTDSVVAGWDAECAGAQPHPRRNVPERCPAPVLHGPLHRRLPRGTERLPRRRHGTAGLALHTAGGAGSRLDRRGRHTLAAAAPTDQNGRGTIMNRIAGAPISWGVCEVPGWGYQLEPNKVLAEMRELGLAATELGPDGFLPADPDELAATLDEYGLAAVGGFTPVLVHEAGHDPVPDIAGLLDAYIAAKAEVMVLAAVTGVDGYDSRPELDDDGWKTLLHNLDRLHDAAAERGIRAVLHPHVGTMIENKDEVTRVLDGSTIPLCLDTGHLLIGGTNPVELVGAAADRITHTHLKDVHADYAARVQSGELTYTQAVAQGMYTPLGTGDADIAGVVTNLLDQGFDGWFTLEQDTILHGEPEGEGPVADVRTSVAYLRSLIP